MVLPSKKKSNLNSTAKSKKSVPKKAQTKAEPAPKQPANNQELESKIQREGKKVSLHFSRMKIKSLPDEVRKIKDASELYLDRNLIQTLPKFMAEFKTLTVLDLHSNNLTTMPIIITCLPNLRVLNLCDNHLTSIPPEIVQLTKLRELYLGLNNLKSVPSQICGLKQLQRIGLSDNKFLRVPKCLRKFKQLVAINFKGNPFLNVSIKECLPSRPKGMLVIRESVLCHTCQSMCQTFREKLENPQTVTSTKTRNDSMVNDRVNTLLRQLQLAPRK